MKRAFRYAQREPPVSRMVDRTATIRNAGTQQGATASAAPPWYPTRRMAEVDIRHTQREVPAGSMANRSAAMRNPSL